MCIWPHSSLCAFLPPPCRVQTPDWHSFWCPLTPNQVSPHTTKVVVPIAWMTDFNRVFTIQCPDKSIPPGISLDWEFLLLYSSALLRFYSATSPVIQHLPALFWSSPFPQLPGLFRSACALPGRAQTLFSRFCLALFQEGGAEQGGKGDVACRGCLIEFGLTCLLPLPNLIVWNQMLSSPVTCQRKIKQQRGE